METLLTGLPPQWAPKGGCPRGTETIFRNINICKGLRQERSFPWSRRQRRNENDRNDLKPYQIFSYPSSSSRSFASTEKSSSVVVS
jgi:hypothetical protein